MALRLNSPAHALQFKQYTSCRKLQFHILPFKSQEMSRSRTTQARVLCAMNMSAGQSDESGKLKFVLEKAKQIWQNAPQPVKSFPWNKAADTFIQLILDLILEVVKYLYVPMFVISCVSELSYSAHERKLYFVLVPFVIGAAIAGILRTAAEEASPALKNAAVPWHLVFVSVFFTLLKLPGPYYPYWGRLFIPHLANGAILRTLWFAFLWYSRTEDLRSRLQFLHPWLGVQTITSETLERF